MIVGIDLDNTIINYQTSFEKIAKFKKIKLNNKFIKKTLKKKKLKKYLRMNGQEYKVRFMVKEFLRQKFLVTLLNF